MLLLSIGLVLLHNFSSFSRSVKIGYSACPSVRPSVHLSVVLISILLVWTDVVLVEVKENEREGVSHRVAPAVSIKLSSKNKELCISFMILESNPYDDYWYGTRISYSQAFIKSRTSTNWSTSSTSRLCLSI